MLSLNLLNKYFNNLLILFLIISCSEEEESKNEINNLLFGLNNISTRFENIDRTYHVYVPKSYSAVNPSPILFNLHGGASTALDFLNNEGDMREIADTANFIIVYPQATSDNNGNPTWHLGAENSKSTDVNDVGFVSHIIDDVSSVYSIDQERVYVTGFSNGGYLTYEIACLLNERIAGIGVVAGHMFIDTYNYCNPSHPTPVINIHGTEDYYNGISGYYLSQDLSNRFWYEYNNTDSNPVISNIENIDIEDGSTVELNSWLNGDNGSNLLHYKVIGGGHSYPTIGSNSIKDYMNGDIDSNILIWNFLSGYDINGKR